MAESLAFLYACIVACEFLRKPEDDFTDLKATPFFPTILGGLTISQLAFSMGYTLQTLQNITADPLVK